MTAVEWLEQKIKANPFRIENDRLWDKAKEMEKKHLYNFYIQGGIDCATQADRTVEDFYNETFKNTKE